MDNRLFNQHQYLQYQYHLTKYFSYEWVSNYAIYCNPNYTIIILLNLADASYPKQDSKDILQHNLKEEAFLRFQVFAIFIYIYNLYV